MPKIFMPMEIQKFKEISTSVYSNVQSLTPANIETLKEILKLGTIKYGRIRTFSLEDSQAIILLTLKQNCLILIKFLLENEVELPEDLLICVIDLLFDRKPSACSGQDSASQGHNIDLSAQIEEERIETQIFNTIIDIVYKSGFSSARLKEFLASKSVPDDASVNFAPMIECKYQSFELIVLHDLVLGPVLLNLILSYKKKLRNAVKSYIIRKLCDKLDSVDYEIVYQIYHSINREEDNALLGRQKPENTAFYLGFVASLICGKESAEIAYEKLLPFLDDLEYAFSVLINSSRVEEKKIQPKDEEILEVALECIVKLVKHKSLNFYKFLGFFQAVLKLKVGRRIKGFIYEILCHYIADREVFIERTVVCKEEIAHELKTHEFFLLPRIIKFINAYERREEFEQALLAQNISTNIPRIDHISGQVSSLAYTSDKQLDMAYKSHRASNPSDTNDDTLGYKIMGLKSEDPESIMECLSQPIPCEILKLNAHHIRNAMVRDVRVVDRLIAYQIANNVALEDVSIIHMIACTPSVQFIEYAKLFSDFAVYLNGDVLERISDNLDDGLDWLNDIYNREVGLFVLKNSSFFNDLLQHNRSSQPQLLKIYEKVLLDNIESVEIWISSGKNESEQNSDVLLVYDTDEYVSDEFFRIFANQILYAKFYTGKNLSKYSLQRQFSHPGYAIYVKAKIVVGLDVALDIKHMKSCLLNTDDLLGYLKVASETQFGLSELIGETKSLSPNILLNFGIKNSEYFLRHFGTASEFERFILFFSLDEVNHEIENIIKDEVMKYLAMPNKPYLNMCVLQLFKCKNLDSILRLLERSYDNKELLFKLNIHNILHGGHYCSKTLITQVDSHLMCKALLILFHLDIWDKNYIVELVNKVESNIPGDAKCLIADIKKY